MPRAVTCYPGVLMWETCHHLLLQTLQRCPWPAGSQAPMGRGWCQLSLWSSAPLMPHYLVSGLSLEKACVGHSLWHNLSRFPTSSHACSLRLGRKRCPRVSSSFLLAAGAGHTETGGPWGWLSPVTPCDVWKAEQKAFYTLWEDTLPKAADAPSGTP